MRNVEIMWGERFRRQRLCRTALPLFRICWRESGRSRNPRMEGAAHGADTDLPEGSSFLEATGLNETIAAYLAGAIINLIAFVAVF